MSFQLLQKLQDTAYLKAILKNISDCLIFINLDGNICLFNDMAAKTLQLKAENLINQPFWKHFPDDAFGFPMKEALTFGISHKLLYVKELEISTHFIYEGPKTSHGMLILFKNISEKLKHQFIAQRNEKMVELGEMAATVAHEIKNPLGAMRGYASLLYRDLENQPHLQEMTEQIIEGTKSLEKVVSNILQYAKPVQIEPKTMDLGAFLRQFGKFLKMDLSFPPHVKLIQHIPDNPTLLPFDPVALKSALLNISLNAIQAMPYGGSLTFSLLKIETSCQIAISDTGVGMEEELLKNLFSPFFTTKQNGNGIGLVETQKIIKAHFGTIEVRSRPNVGTTFTLTLPLKRVQ